MCRGGLIFAILSWIFPKFGRLPNGGGDLEKSISIVAPWGDLISAGRLQFGRLPNGVHNIEQGIYIIGAAGGLIRAIFLGCFRNSVAYLRGIAI